MYKGTEPNSSKKTEKIYSEIMQKEKRRDEYNIRCGHKIKFFSLLRHHLDIAQLLSSPLLRIYISHIFKHLHDVVPVHTLQTPVSLGRREGYYTVTPLINGKFFPALGVGSKQLFVSLGVGWGEGRSLLRRHIHRN